MSSLCIGITSYNCLPYLRHNILSILKNDIGIDLTIIVNDNYSTDGTQLWLADRSEFGYLNNKKKNVRLDYSLNSFNGFASYGCNQSINYFLTQTECSYFLHLDPDCEIRDSSAFDSAISQLNSDKGLGAIGEKRFALRYKHPKARSLKAFDEYVMSGKWSDFVCGKKYDQAYLEGLLLEKHPSSDYLVYKELCGNVMFFKREVVEKIGNVDIQKFKMWRWDSEYSMRCYLFDYSVASADVVESLAIRHFGGKSRNSASDHDSNLRKDLNITDEELKTMKDRYGFRSQP